MEIKGIKYIGPIFDGSGYSKANRGNILALYRAGVPITISPISFEEAKPNLGEDGRILNSLINKNIDYNITIIHTTPEFWNKYKEPNKFHLNYTIWETNKLHPKWVPYINDNSDAIMVGCDWNIKVFKDSGVNVPIFNIPHVLEVEEFENANPYTIKGLDDDTFAFYSVMQWCYDEKTRVLTKNGFKYFKDLSYDDEVATLNKKTDVLEYHKPDKIVSFRRKDKMLSLKGKQFDLCVTPDHKMLIKECVGGSVDPNDSWQLKPLNELIVNKRINDVEKIVSSKYRTKKNCKWDGIDQIYFDIPGINTKIKMDVFLKFLGWYISEGNLEINSNCHRVIFSQKKNLGFINEIYDCIKDMGFSSSKSGKNLIFDSKDMCMYLEQFGKCHEKFIPQFVKNLSSRQIKIFLTSLFNGDLIKYTTTSKRLAEDVQECLLKVGTSGAVSISNPIIAKTSEITNDGETKSKLYKYTVFVNKYHNEPSMCYAKLEELDYDGYVYCATVKNHNMLVERNGKVLFCGNTERKNPLATIKSYWQSFPNNENVALVLKTYRSDYSEIEKEAIRTTIRRLKHVCPAQNYPPILLILDMLKEDEMKGLFARGNCYVSLDRGEGFGLGGAQAGAAGKPIIVTGFGGVTEYAKSDNSYLVDYVEIPVFGMPYSPWYLLEQNWAEASQSHAVKLMRHVYNNQEEAKARGQKLKTYIKENFSSKVIGQKIIEAIRSL